MLFQYIPETLLGIAQPLGAVTEYCHIEQRFEEFFGGFWFGVEWPGQVSLLDALSCLVVSWSCKLARHRCTASLHNSTLWRRVRWLSSFGVSGGVSVAGDGMMIPFLMASIDKTRTIFVMS